MCLLRIESLCTYFYNTKNIILINSLKLLKEKQYVHKHGKYKIL